MNEMLVVPVVPRVRLKMDLWLLPFPNERPVICKYCGRDLKSGEGFRRSKNETGDDGVFFLCVVCADRMVQIAASHAGFPGPGGYNWSATMGGFIPVMVGKYSWETVFEMLRLKKDGENAH